LNFWTPTRRCFRIVSTVIRPRENAQRELCETGVAARYESLQMQWHRRPACGFQNGSLFSPQQLTGETPVPLPVRRLSQRLIGAPTNQELTRTPRRSQTAATTGTGFAGGSSWKKNLRLTPFKPKRRERRAPKPRVSSKLATAFWLVNGSARPQTGRHP